MASLEAENKRLREALRTVRWWLDAQNEPSLDRGWVMANKVINKALAKDSLKSSPSDLQKGTFAGNEGAKDTESP